MGGLRKICKAYGGMTVTIDGKTTEYVWDYVKDEPVLKEEFDHARWVASEHKKYEAVKRKLEKQKAEEAQLGLF